MILCTMRKYGTENYGHQNSCELDHDYQNSLSMNEIEAMTHQLSIYVLLFQSSHKLQICMNQHSRS